jgi:hypothetical protein
MAVSLGSGWKRLEAWDWESIENKNAYRTAAVRGTKVAGLTPPR